jgi:hypothetical protein
MMFKQAYTNGFMYVHGNFLKHENLHWIFKPFFKNYRPKHLKTFMDQNIEMGIESSNHLKKNLDQNILEFLWPKHWNLHWIFKPFLKNYKPKRFRNFMDQNIKIYNESKNRVQKMHYLSDRSWVSFKDFVM